MQTKGDLITKSIISTPFYIDLVKDLLEDGGWYKIAMPKIINFEIILNGDLNAMFVFYLSDFCPTA